MAQLLGLREIPPRPHPEEVGHSTTTHSTIKSLVHNEHQLSIDYFFQEYEKLERYRGKRAEV